MENQEEEERLELIPRNYQEALFNQCLRDNTIIFLPTGAGKTFIAIMILKQMGEDLVGENHKVSIILVNTVALVDQHVKYVKKHTPFKVGGYSGEMNVDYWSAVAWHDEVNNNQVLVMTSAIFQEIVSSQKFDLNRINLMIFDECHHAVNDQPMRVSMKEISKLPTMPKIVGLTATLLNGNCKSEKVMNEVRNLEVTFHSRIATVDGLEAVVGYATNPQEKFTKFLPHTSSQLEMGAIQQIEILMVILGQLKVETKQLRRGDLLPLEQSNDNRKLINILKDVIMHIRMFGIYGGRIACLVGNIQMRRFLFNCTDLKFSYAIQSIQTCLGKVINTFKMAMNDCMTEKERIYKYSSSKILELIRELKEFKENSTEELCSLVFVERRATAKVLHHLLNSLSKNDDDFSFVKSDFIVGSPNNASITLESLYISKKNREVLSRFVNKQTNLLCTSQVLEEGIDIPKCTLVIKFDPPKDYRSYIQSKGRARHIKSKYLIMAPVNEFNKIDQQYNQFKEIEDTLNAYLIGKKEERTVPSKEEIDQLRSDEKLQPFYVDGPGSAFIEPVTAISLLCRYCQTLQTDRYSLFAPEWYYSDVPKRGIRVTVYLPPACPLRDPIEGIFMGNKKMAKRAAAFQACVELFKAGELTTHLLPKPRELEETDVSFLFTHYPEKKERDAGLKKMRLHDLVIPECIKGPISPEKSVFLHVICLEPNFEVKEDETACFNPAHLTYGFITPNRLPRVCDFPLFIKNGPINVHIETNVKECRLTEEEIKTVKRFHFGVFKDVLDVVASCFVLDHTDEAEAIFLVPVDKLKEDIDRVILKRHQDVVSLEYKEDAEKAKMVVKRDTYHNGIVYPFYRIDPPNYLVMAVCEDMTPLSSFPNEDFTDFCAYYRIKYNTEIFNKQQALLRVKPLSNNMQVYKPIGAQNKRRWNEKRATDAIEYLVPEMLGKREFPTELWIQGRLLPCILYRLTHMLRVEQLWQKIRKDCDFAGTKNTMKPLKVNMSLLKYETSLEEKDKDVVMVKNCEESERVEAKPPALLASSSDHLSVQTLEESRYPWKDLDEPKDIERVLDVTTLDIYAYCQFINTPISQDQRKEIYTSPKKYNNVPALTFPQEYKLTTIKMLWEKKTGVVDLADMYEALTTPKANDIVHLERLETLGDSFLKFLVSHYIQLRFPHFEEGRATQLKSRMISNKNLFYLAQKYNIGGIIRNSRLRLNEGWVPPGFCVPKNIREDICNKTVSWKILHSLSFEKEEMISGPPEKEDFKELKNQYREENAEDSFNDTDECLKKQYLKDKCVADSVEAIFGTYLLHMGMPATIKVIEWMGVIPASEGLVKMMKERPPSAAFSRDVTLKHIKQHLPLYDEIEEIINYKFKDRSFLLQAFTHASYTPNRYTPSYEKLEFLGDAVLDFLITCFIYEMNEDMTPGDLTDLRSALVNNNTFASFVVRLGLHKYLLLMNSKLQHYIDQFVDFFVIKKDFVIDDEVLILAEEGELNLAEYVDVPKALGDLFEAIAGAVFMDSGYNLETVWKVFYPIMWKEIFLFSANVPKNVVRRLYETEGAYPEFGPTVDTGCGTVMVKLNFLAEGRPKYVHGFGSNKALARKAAAKLALRSL